MQAVSVLRATLRKVNNGWKPVVAKCEIDSCNIQGVSVMEMDLNLCLCVFGARFNKNRQ